MIYLYMIDAYFIHHGKEQGARQEGYSRQAEQGKEEGSNLGIPKNQ